MSLEENQSFLDQMAEQMATGNPAVPPTKRPTVLHSATKTGSTIWRGFPRLRTTGSATKPPKRWASGLPHWIR